MGDLFSTAGKTSLLSVIIYLKIDHFTVFVVTGEGEVTKSERQHTWGGKRSWNRLICFGDKWNSFNFRGSFSLFKRKKKKQRNFKTQLKISWLVKDTFAPRRSSNPPGLWPQANTLRTRREGWFGKKKGLSGLVQAKIPLSSLLQLSLGGIGKKWLKLIGRSGSFSDVNQNWYRWKYKKEIRGWREGRRLIGEEETFPEKAIKLIDDFPRGMFPQVCFVCVCVCACVCMCLVVTVQLRNAILGRRTSAIK